MTYYPKISIITVVFNDVKHIENTILSVIRQTYNNIEYIIVDGGSTDGTIEVIKKYKNYISIIISEKDNGIYDAMNKGVNASTGDWILFRNCGDYFSSNGDVAKVFNGNSYDNVDIISGDLIRWDKYGYYKTTPNFLKKDYNGMTMPVEHPATFIKASLQKKYPFNLRYKLAGDHDFFFHCLIDNCNFYYIPITLGIFDACEGASSKHENISIKEHILIHKGIITNYDFISLYIRILIIKAKMLIKNLMPNWIMKIRKTKQGRCIWTKSFEITDMVNSAINNEDTNF